MIDRRAMIVGTGASAMAGLGMQSAAGRTLQSEKTASAHRNASIYQFQIGGDIKATVISDGQIAFPAYPAYAPGQTEGEVHASMRANGLEPPNYLLDANSLLLDTGTRKILIDTGWGPFAPEVGHLANNLRLAGIRPNDIDTIVLSHIHPDHVGGLRDANGQIQFPNAEVIVSEQELPQWENGAGFGEMMVDEAFKPVFRSAAQSVASLGDRLLVAQDSYEIASGITFLLAPGHTRGHSLVRVSSGSDTFLYAADAFHDQAFDVSNPSWRTAYDYNASLAEQSRRSILEEAASESETIMAYHLPFPGLGTVLRDRQGYRFLPSRWALN